MFGIGVPELILIAIVALVVVGPKNLPGTLRAVGAAIREFRKVSRELREQAGFDEVVDEVTRPLREGLSGVEADVLREHWALAMELHGEQVAGRSMRKFAIKYARVHPEPLAVRDAFIGVKVNADWQTVLDRFYATDGPGRDPAADVDEVSDCDAA